MSLEGNALYIGTFGGSPSDVFISKVMDGYRNHCV